MHLADPAVPVIDGIPLLHADEALLVLDKPAGLLAVPGRGEDKQDCLSTRVQRRYPDAFIVHRLDMATSGLMLMARGAGAQRVVSQAFEKRQVHKRYTAVVSGHVGTPAGDWDMIDLPILLDWPRRPISIINTRGKPSLTRWRVQAHEHLPTGQPVSRLELEPLTGRSHQLRVHLQAIGHPIIGDTLYADEPSQSASPRLLLHACALSLTHPVTGEILSFDSAPFF